MLDKVRTVSELASKNYSEFSLRKFGKQYVLKTGNKYVSKHEDKSEICTHKSEKVFENEYALLCYLERRI